MSFYTFIIKKKKESELNRRYIPSCIYIHRITLVDNYIDNHWCVREKIEMSQTKARQSLDAEEILRNETRLNRLHRLFQTNYNVPEPSKILEPYLYLGNCISAQDINRLEQLNIRYILNVASRDVEICPYYSSDMRVLTIDLQDNDQENILRVFDKAFRFIDEARKTQSRVLVHCSNGQR